MGYKINSIWTELRKDDIMELNAIIDDEYCNDECNKCSINHLCNDLHNTLKTLSESGFILKF